MVDTFSPLNISDLDFDDIKRNLKTYLKDQSEFSDYDFEGSGLATIINLLAYNTYMNSFLINMAVNESALESAQLRNNIVSRAKMLGYTPRSYTAPSATVNITISGNSDSPGSIVIPKNTKFTTTVDSTSYTFVTIESTFVQKNSDNNYVAENVTIKEGIPLEFRFVVDKDNPDQTFIIPNETIDTSTLLVKVQTSSTDLSTETFLLADEFITIDEDDAVYWLHESDNYYYELQFGNGVVGKELKNSNIVICEYLATSGPSANKASTFTAAEDIAGFSSGISIETVSSATGGKVRETDSSIRFLAPKNYEAQNRMVTKSDYETIIKRDFTNYLGVKIWGGENNDPPIYGKVFISINPNTGTALTTNEKNQIKNDIIQSINVVSITPEIIDAEYTYLIINSIVKYEKRLTTKTANQIKTNVITTIENFDTTYLQNFDTHFRYSHFTNEIDKTDNSIQSNLTTIKLKKKLEPTLNASDTYTVKFNNEIKNPYSGYIGAVKSSNYVHKTESGTQYTGCFLEDDGDGILKVKRLSNNTKVTIESNVGTVNYTTGKVVVTAPFYPVSYSGSTFDIIAEPKYNDIIPVREQILRIDKDNDVYITMEEDSEVD